MRRQDHVSNSERYDMTCEHRWWLKRGLLLSLRRPRIAARIGTLWHFVMARYWAAVRDGLDPLTRARAACDEVEAGLTETTSDGFDPQATHDLERGVVAETCDLLREMAWGYHREVGGGLAARYEPLLIEEFLETPIGSTGMRWVGRADLVVQDEHGQVWVLDHKTSGRALSAWLRENRYSPQGQTYAWQVSEELGRPVVGFIHALSLRSRRVTAEDLPVVKSGSRLAKKVPDGCPPGEFERALAMHGFGVGDVDWYSVRLQELTDVHDQGYYHRTETVRLPPGTLERTREEAAWVSRRKAELESRAAWARRAVRDAFERRGREDAEQVIVAAERELGPSFVRNPSECHPPGRWECPLMEFCMDGARDSLTGYDLRGLDAPEDPVEEFRA